MWTPGEVYKKIEKIDLKNKDKKFKDRTRKISTVVTILAHYFFKLFNNGRRRVGAMEK